MNHVPDDLPGLLVFENSTLCPKKPNPVTV